MSERRMQQLAEQILTDSGLTGDMDDAQANTLINWGVAAAKRLALRSEGMDDAQAEEFLYPPMKNLRRTIRRINKMFGDFESMTPEDFKELADKLFEAAQEVPVLKVNPPDFSSFTYEYVKSLEPDRRLQALLEHITLPEDAAEGKADTDASPESETPRKSINAIFESGGAPKADSDTETNSEEITEKPHKSVNAIFDSKPEPKLPPTTPPEEEDDYGS